jgi:hypothetical protein
MSYRQLTRNCSEVTCLVKVKGHIATDRQSINKTWCRNAFRAHDQIFITLRQLESCFSGDLSDERTGMPFVYAVGPHHSIVFQGSEFLGTRDHILLSQILDFRFRRLLRLAGSRGRYSNPPPHGWPQTSKSKLCYDHRFSRPVCLGIQNPSGAYDQIIITVRLLQAYWCGALFLTKGRICHLPHSVSSNTPLVSMYNLHVKIC